MTHVDAVLIGCADDCVVGLANPEGLNLRVVKKNIESQPHSPSVTFIYTQSHGSIVPWHSRRISDVQGNLSVSDRHSCEQEQHIAEHRKDRANFTDKASSSTDN